MQDIMFNENNINLNLYKEFYKVANSKSLSEASTKHNKSSVSFSKNIKDLEDILGVSLFYRTPQGMVLTDAGKELYKYVDEAIIFFNTGTRITLANNDISNSKIIVGCPSHIATFYLMNFIDNLKNDYPDIKIKIIAGLSGNELLNLLSEHKIDFIIDSTKLNVDTTNFKVIKIKEMSNIFIANREIKIKQAKELEQYKYILPFENTFTKRKLIECLSSKNININTDMEIDITEVRINAVKQGLGIGYILEDAVKFELENKVLYKVETPFKLPSINLNMIYYKGILTKADILFIKKYLKLKNI